jgi:hypothetical protein
LGGQNSLRLDLFPSGLIGDLFVDSVSVATERTGDSRYILRVTGAINLQVALWTTQKDRIRVIPWEDDRPPWITLSLGPSSELAELRAADCSLHLEHLDRPFYFVGLERANERWGVQLAASGYIKTRVLSPLPTAG